MIIGINAGSGGGSGNTYTDGSLAVTTLETTGAFSVPAGSVWLEIRNAGMVQPGDLEANATVNAVSWSPGRNEKWEARQNPVSLEYQLLPAVTGNGNGSRVMISYGTPV